MSLKKIQLKSEHITISQSEDQGQIIIYLQCTAKLIFDLCKKLTFFQLLHFIVAVWTFMIRNEN